MKIILFFVILLAFVVCQPSNEKREEIRKKRKERDMQLAECILKNENISSELKKLIEENKDEHLMKALHPRDHKLDRNDRDIIRNCRKEMFEKMKEEHKREKERRNKNHDKNDL